MVLVPVEGSGRGDARSRFDSMGTSPYAALTFCYVGTVVTEVPGARGKSRSKLRDEVMPYTITTTMHHS